MKCVRDSTPKQILLLLYIGLMACAGRVSGEQAELPVFLVPTKAFHIGIDLSAEKVSTRTDLLIQFMDRREDTNTPVSAWLDMGIQLGLHGEYEKALYCLNIVRERDESRLPIAGWALLALAEEEKGAWESALRGWRRILETDPRNEQAWMRAGLCHLRMGNPSQAQQLFARRHQQRPNDPLILHMMGVSRYLMGDSSRAWRDFARAAVTGSPHVETHLMLAYLSVKAGDQEEAIGWLRLALQNVPREERSRYAYLPHFDALREVPHYVELLDDLQVAGMDPTRQSQDANELEWPASWNIDRASEPAQDLWVDIRLRPIAPSDGDEPDASPAAGLTGFRGLQLHMVSTNSAYQEIAPIDKLD